jgi:hypothetical protein
VFTLYVPKEPSAATSLASSLLFGALDTESVDRRPGVKVTALRERLRRILQSP